MKLDLFGQKKLDTAASEDDAELAEITESLHLVRPSPGGPFSALTPSMWPQDILTKLGQPEVSVGVSYLSSPC